MRLRSCGVAILLVTLSPHLAGAKTYPLNYTLAKPSKVSVNIYDSEGRVVRELLHAAPRPAGAQAEVWDGLDSNNNSLPAGSYTWKLLGTQGLQAKFLQNLGSSYAPGVAPGCHGGPAAVAVADGAMYVSASSAEIVDALLVKQTLDGKLIWHAPHVEVYQGGKALAVAGDVVRMLTGKGNIWSFSATNGAYQGAYSVAWSGDTSFPYDMDLNDQTMVISYSNHDAIRWINPANGAVLDTAPVPAPQGVTVAPDGTVYVTTADKIVKLSRTNHTLVDVATGLTSPTTLDLDHSTGNLLVVEAGASQQVKLLAPSGKLLKTYGQVGGRGDGLYTAAMQQSFKSVTDVAADSQGGFLVVELNAPRRTASLRLADGSLIQEWYGGQVWTPWISPEPDNPNVGWMVSSWVSLMRMTLNPTNNTWQVHSTYTFSGLAGGLIQNHDNAQIWEVRQHAGTTYLCRSGDPCVVKVDEKNWRLLPVTVGGTKLQHYWSAQPQLIKDWAGRNDSFLWTDQNGDGIPQQTEMKFFPIPGDWGGGSVYVADNFNYYSYVGGAAWTSPTNNTIKVHAVTGWNEVGAPLYGHFPVGQVFSTNIPTRAQGIGVWGAYLHRDSTTGDLYAGFNAKMPWWGVSPDSFLTKFDSAGKERWTVGRKGTGPGTVTNAFRRFVGQAHGCVVLTDFNGGWNGTIGPSYVWDTDGLWVGGLFDNPDRKVGSYSLSGDNLAGTLYTNPSTGETLFFGSWENDARVYRITGWDAFTRQTGRLTLALPSLPKPTFTAVPGLYNHAQAVTISATTAGATIRYTTDGSPPSQSNGTIYNTPVIIHANTTLKAIAYKSGMADSELTAGDYVIDYNLWVSGKDSRGNWIINHPALCANFTMTTSSAAGWTPNRDRLHDGAIAEGSDFQWNDINDDPAKPYKWLQIDLGSEQLVRALRIWNGGRDYDLGAMGNMEVYVDNTPQSNNTAFVSHGRLLLTTQLLQPTQIKTAVDSGVINLPTPTRGRYVTLRFTTFTAQYQAISEVGVCFTQRVTPPTFAAAAGTKLVAISTGTSGATIRYTTDGRPPSPTVGTVYSRPVNIGSNTTLKAIAYKSGMADSEVITQPAR